MVHVIQHREVERALVAWSASWVYGGSNLTGSTERWALAIAIIWRVMITYVPKSGINHLRKLMQQPECISITRVITNGFTYGISAIIQLLTTKLYIQCVIISQLFSWLQNTPFSDKFCKEYLHHMLPKPNFKWTRGRVIQLGFEDIIRMQRGYERDHVEVIH